MLLPGKTTVANAADAEAVFDEREVLRVQALPGFEAAARQAVACWLPRDENDANDTGLLRDLGRFVAAIWTLYLDAEPGGVTRSRVEVLLAATGVSSPARAASMLIYLRFIGYIEPAPDKDARARRFVPTAKLWAAFLGRIRRELEWAALLDADVAQVLARFDERGMARTWAHRQGEHTVSVMQYYSKPDVSLDVFSQRNAGLMILAGLLRGAGPAETFPAPGPVCFSVSRLAKLSASSRVHVRNQLRAAERAGLLADLAEGEATVTPALVHHVRYFIACSALMFAWIARRALQDVSAPP
jgi:hypothetical protein